MATISSISLLGNIQSVHPPTKYTQARDTIFELFSPTDSYKSIYIDSVPPSCHHSFVVSYFSDVQEEKQDSLLSLSEQSNEILRHFWAAMKQTNTDKLARLQVQPHVTALLEISSYSFPIPPKNIGEFSRIRSPSRS